MSVLGSVSTNIQKQTVNYTTIFCYLTQDFNGILTNPLISSQMIKTYSRS